MHPSTASISCGGKPEVALKGFLPPPPPAGLSKVQSLRPCTRRGSQGLRRFFCGMGCLWGWAEDAGHRAAPKWHLPSPQFLFPAGGFKKESCSR